MQSCSNNKGAAQEAKAILKIISKSKEKCKQLAHSTEQKRRCGRPKNPIPTKKFASIKQATAIMDANDISPKRTTSTLDPTDLSADNYTIAMQAHIEDVNNIFAIPGGPPNLKEAVELIAIPGGAPDLKEAVELLSTLWEEEETPPGTTQPIKEDVSPGAEIIPIIEGLQTQNSEVTTILWANDVQARRAFRASCSIAGRTMSLEAGDPVSSTEHSRKVQQQHNTDIMSDESLFTKREEAIMVETLKELLSEFMTSRETLFSNLKAQLDMLTLDADTSMYNMQLREKLRSALPDWADTRLNEVLEECALRNTNSIRQSTTLDSEFIKNILRNKSHPVKGLLDIFRRNLPFLPRNQSLHRSLFAKYAFEAATRLRKSVHIIFSGGRNIRVATSLTNMALVTAPSKYDKHTLVELGILSNNAAHKIHQTDGTMTSSDAFAYDIPVESQLKLTMSNFEATALMLARSIKRKIHLIIDEENNISLATSDDNHRCFEKLKNIERYLWEENFAEVSKQSKATAHTFIMPLRLERYPPLKELYPGLTDNSKLINIILQLAAALGGKPMDKDLKYGTKTMATLFIPMMSKQQLQKSQKE